MLHKFLNLFEKRKKENAANANIILSRKNYIIRIFKNFQVLLIFKFKRKEKIYRISRILWRDLHRGKNLYAKLHLYNEFSIFNRQCYAFTRFSFAFFSLHIAREQHIHELDNVCNSPTILLKRSHLCVNFLSGTVRAKES